MTTPTEYQLKKYNIKVPRKELEGWLKTLQTEELELIRLCRLKKFALFDVTVAASLPVNVHIEGSAMLHSFTDDASEIELKHSDETLIEIVRFVGFGRVYFQVKDGEYVYDSFFTKCVKSYDLRSGGATKELDYFIEKAQNDSVQTETPSEHSLTQG